MVLQQGKLSQTGTAPTTLSRCQRVTVMVSESNGYDVREQRL
jgi:hypothetical protein